MDFFVVDDIEDVVRIPGRRPQGEMPREPLKAMRTASTEAEPGQFDAAYLRGAVTWTIASEGLAAPLQSGDLIEDRDGFRYTIQSANESTTARMWTCASLNLAIIYELGDLLTIERASITLDNAGAQRQLYPPDGGEVRYLDLRGRVQPQEATSKDERGIRGKATRYTVPVEFEIDVDMDRDRVKWTDRLGDVRYLEIVAYRNAESVSALPELECALAP